MSSDRRAMIAKLHVARKQLAMEEADYRALLMRSCGLTSSAKATPGQLMALLAEMRHLGFRDAPRPISDKPHVRKIWALWKDMAPLLENSTDAGLRHFCFRQTRLSDPEWLDGAQATKVIEALKAWHERLQKAATAKAEAAS